MLQTALRVRGPSGASVRVQPCPYYAPPMPLIRGASTPALSATNATCAVVKISPPLTMEQAATLVLPRGARYNSLAGPLAEEQSVQVRVDWGVNLGVRGAAAGRSTLRPLWMHTPACCPQCE